MPYTNYLNIGSLPRGLRNNNPGNLIQTNIGWQGKIPISKNTDSRFEQFKELRYGIRALMLDIISDYKKGLVTLNLIISEFAPSFENNTQSYINTVSKSVGISPYETIRSLDQDLLIRICKAIVFVENGASFTSYISDKDYADALSILGKKLPIGDGKKAAIIGAWGFTGLAFIATYFINKKIKNKS